ncbi:MAG: type II toxin-antitoxin system VapC family toxin [Spirochaetota bacterium]
MRISCLFDTNAISEMARPEPNPQLRESFASHEGLVAVPAIVWHELLFGVARLPDGRQKRRLRAFLLDVMAPGVPVLPYDGHAAWIHADLRAEGELSGHPSPFVDAQIAAIALADNVILVTRNTPDFSSYRSLMLENWFAESDGG